MGGDLPFSWAAERGDIHFAGAGFVRRIGQPAPVGRNLSLRAVLDQQKGLALSFEREGPQVLGANRPAIVDQVLAIASPLADEDELVLGIQLLFRPAAIGGFAG